MSRGGCSVWSVSPSQNYRFVRNFLTKLYSLFLSLARGSSKGHYPGDRYESDLISRVWEQLVFHSDQPIKHYILVFTRHNGLVVTQPHILVFTRHNKLVMTDEGWEASCPRQTKNSLNPSTCSRYSSKATDVCSVPTT